MDKTIDMMASVYIQAYGPEKWASLSVQEKHDVVMALVKLSLKTLDALTEKAEG